MRKAVPVVFALALLAAVALVPIPSGQAGENLVLNPKLDYNSDSEDGPLITGDDLGNAELLTTRTTYVFIYGEG